MPDYRNRIVGYEECVDPEQLLSHPENWRIHPKHQQEALQGSLEELGWVDAVHVNVNTQHVVDGHLRAAQAISAGSCAPVLYVDLDEEEELKMLASFDVITGLAITDSDMLRGIADRISFQSGALATVVRGAVSSVVRESPEPPEGEPNGDVSAGDPATPTADPNSLSWGYMAWKAVRISSSETEITLLNEVYEDYKSRNGGLDVGFVRWLVVRDDDE